jgi:hypothetical protein
LLSQTQVRRHSDDHLVVREVFDFQTH